MNKNTKTILIASALVLTILILNYTLTSPACWLIPQEDLEEIEFVEPTEDSIETRLIQVEEQPFLVIPTIGESMLPNIKDSSYCLCIRQDTYEVGDIVNFYVYDNGDPRFILHRIVDIGTDGQGTWYILKGDNNEYQDNVVLREDNIFCKVPEFDMIDRIIMAIK